MVAAEFSESTSGLHSTASDGIQLLCSHLFDVGPPDLVRHPGRPSFRFLNLDSLSREQMDPLCAALSEPDVLMASIGRLQSRMAGRFSREDSDLVALLVSQSEIS